MTDRRTSIMRIAGYLCVLILVPLIIVACGAPNAADDSAIGTTATAIPATPDLSNCGDEYSRPLSASYSVRDGATLDPNTVYTPTINITRADYEAGLTKWRAQGITEYEIAVSNVSYLGEGTILRVGPGKVEVLGHFYWREHPYPVVTPTTKEPSEYDLENSVEGLFEHVDSILTHGVCPMRGEMAFPVAYEIEFHETYGFPTSISRDAWEPKEWEKQGIYSSLPAHSSYSKAVERFIDIKKAVPLTNSTVQPTP